MSTSKLLKPSMETSNYIIEEQPISQPNPQVFTAAKFANELPYDPNVSFYEKFMTGLGDFLGAIGSIPICVCFPNPYKSVPQGRVGLVSRFGKYIRTSDPGLTWVNPCTEKLGSIDIKIQIVNIANVSIMTKDNVNITIDCVIYWHIVDPFQAHYGVSDVRSALMERAQTTIRAVLGQRSLQDCIENRDEIAQDIENIILGPATSWGVKVESVLIKDLIFSRELQENLSSAAQAKRIGESRVIAAQAEVDSAKLMREAADILNSPAAIQIRYLETMQNMARTSGSKIIFMPFNSATNGEMGDNQNLANTLAIQSAINQHD